jgi:hypothetical protein
VTPPPPPPRMHEPHSNLSHITEDAIDHITTTSTATPPLGELFYDQIDRMRELDKNC